MRADRLVSILLLLQARGKMSARELSEELEVSQRTIYRDINALCIAGVPVFSETGPEGGYDLIDRYRTNLTGLTAGEVQALSMLNIPAPLADLGVREQLQSALLKLSAALPDDYREAEEKVRQRIYLDSTWWQQGEEQVPHILTVQEGVWQNRKLLILYRPHYSFEIEQLVDPYGLVAKAGIWYLVYARKEVITVERVSRLINVSLTEQRFLRPMDFDLESFWEVWCRDTERMLTGFKVLVRVSPDFIPELPRFFGSSIQTRISAAEPPDEEGWIKLELFFDSFDAARDRLLGFGQGVEVLDPLSLRLSILDYAEQVLSIYSQSAMLDD
jgi:predicted DNA-binding transcriptional regulator YafY